MKKSFMFTVLFFIFTFFVNAYAGSDLYNKFLHDMEEFETGEPSAQVERYKYTTAEYAIKNMIINNDMIGLKLMSQHKMWDAIKTIGFGGVLQIAAEAKSLETFTFILNNKDYIKDVTTDSYLYTDLIDTQNFLQQQVQKNNDKVFVEMKKLLDAFIKKYPFVQGKSIEHKNNQITIKDILSKNDNMYDVLLSMKLYLFPLSESDLVDINNEKSYSGYSAFSIPIPAELVKEAVLTAKQSDNYLSRLVLKYPYIQLIVEYWIINKIYSIYKSNPKLIGASGITKDYKSFNKYLSYQYLPYEEYAKNSEGKSNLGYTATFESMAKVLLQLDKQIYKTLSYKKESGYEDYSKELIYNITDFQFAIDSAFRNTDFTLYDFIYDLFYSGVCKTLRASFQNGMINKYIPLYKLPDNTFTYKELKFKQLYGSETELEYFSNIDRNIVRLESSNPKLSAEESIIVKSADNEYSKKYKEHSYNFQNDYYNPKLGSGYDELWEICGRSLEHAKANKQEDTDLYIKWFFTPLEEPKPPMRKYPERITDDKGNVIKEIYEYTYKETEEILGTHFYFTHNFHVKTPCFYRRRMMYGYEWDRMTTIDDVLYATSENMLVSSLYYKYMGLQLITAAFISIYTGGK